MVSKHNNNEFYLYKYEQADFISFLFSPLYFSLSILP